jgi:hypothetical protein
VVLGREITEEDEFSTSSPGTFVLYLETLPS